MVTVRPLPGTLAEQEVPKASREELRVSGEPSRHQGSKASFLIFFFL